MLINSTDFGFGFALLSFGLVVTEVVSDQVLFLKNQQASVDGKRGN